MPLLFIPELDKDDQAVYSDLPVPYKISPPVFDQILKKMQLRTLNMLLLFLILGLVHVNSAADFGNSDQYSYNDTNTIRRYLMEALKRYFSSSVQSENSVEEIELQSKPILSSDIASPTECTAHGYTHSEAQTSIVYKLPLDIMKKILVNFLEVSDLSHLSSTCRYSNKTVKVIDEINMSEFCPHFVLPDPILNRIFYHSIIKPLGVESIHDESMKDIIKLMTLKRVYNGLPVPYKISPLVFDQMFMCLFEAVHGLNSTIPLTKNSQRLFFSKQFNDQDLPKTLEYIETDIGNSVYMMNVMHFVKTQPTQEEIHEFANNPEKRYTPLYECVELTKYTCDTPLPNLPDNFCEMFLGLFYQWLKLGNYFPWILEAFLAAKFDFVKNKELLETFNLNLLQAILSRDPYKKSIDYDYEQLLSLTLKKEEIMCPIVFLTLTNDHSTNLTQLDLISNIIRSGSIDLSNLFASHRSYVLSKLLFCRNPMVLEMILNEIPNSINLLVDEKILDPNRNAEYADSRIVFVPVLNSPVFRVEDSNDEPNLKNIETIINHVRIRSFGNPLAILFILSPKQDEHYESILDRFELNKNTFLITISTSLNCHF